ncbi:hypothetical protein GCM10010195_56460 [Kitasatospora griseola]|nr:hypothetical protein GCM10010195_56460 [Kitasatospora griseola]
MSRAYIKHVRTDRAEGNTQGLAALLKAGWSIRAGLSWPVVYAPRHRTDRAPWVDSSGTRRHALECWAIPPE